MADSEGDTVIGPDYKLIARDAIALRSQAPAPSNYDPETGVCSVCDMFGCGCECRKMQAPAPQPAQTFEHEYNFRHNACDCGCPLAQPPQPARMFVVDMEAPLGQNIIARNEDYRMNLKEYIEKFTAEHPGMVERSRCEYMRDYKGSDERICTSKLPCDHHAESCVYCGNKHPWVFAEHECPDSMGYDAASLTMTLAARVIPKERLEDGSHPPSDLREKIGDIIYEAQRYGPIDITATADAVLAVIEESNK